MSQVRQDKKKMGQIKEQIKDPERNTTKSWRDSQPIRCRVQNTGNQDAHRIGWIWLQNRGKSEGYAKWNKEKLQGTNSDGKETGTQIHGLEQKEEIGIQKNEKFRNVQDNFKHSNIWIIGVPEGEEEEQEIENLFENIMKENFPNVAKEIDFQEVQEAQRVPKMLDPRNTPRHIIITFPKIKDKERILKAAREKETITYKGVPLRL